jgi:hypothetical protein
MVFCVGFCLLTAAVAFLFSWMMGSCQLTTFRVPAIENQWDLETKARACRNAGMMYLFIALALVARSMFRQPVSHDERVTYYGITPDDPPGERAPLLSNDESAPDSSARRRFAPQYNGRLYGGVAADHEEEMVEK